MDLMHIKINENIIKIIDLIFITLNEKNIK